MKPAIISFFWVAGPKILAGALQFILTLALLRHFDPADFGAISVCISGVLLGDSIIGGATDSGVLRLAPSSSATTPTGSLQFQQAGLVLKLALSAIIAIPTIFLLKRISWFLFQTDHGRVYLAISQAALIGMLMLRSAQMLYQIKERFLPYGISDLTNSLLKFGGLGLLLLLARPSPAAVLSCYAVAPFLVIGLILFFSQGALVRVPFSRTAFQELAYHVKWFLLVSATGTVIARMDVFLVSSLAGISSAGIYSAAQTITLVPQLIGSYIAVVFSPRIMPMWEKGNLRKLYCDFQLSIFACSVVAFILALLIIPRTFGLIFPLAFRQSQAVILVLLPAGLCALINFPLTILLLLFMRPRFLVTVDLVLLPVLLLAYVLVIPVYGVMGAAIVTTLGALAKTGVMQVAAWRLLLESAPTPGATISFLQPIEGESHAK